MSNRPPAYIEVIQTLLLGQFLYWFALVLGFGVVGPHVFYAIHGYEFFCILKPERLANALYQLSVSDVALDEGYVVLLTDGIKLTLYITFFCVVYNIFGAWSWIKFTVIYVALPGVLAAIVLHNLGRVRESLAATLPIVLKYGNIALGYVVRAVYRIYRGFVALCRHSGWFFEIDPIDTDRPQYVYRPLPTDRTIRLLELSRKYPWGPLQLELHQYDIESCPPYEAISYTWGDPSELSFIIIDGRKLELSANAFEVIRQRSSYWNNRLIWIDSVCINQGNIQERNKQISLMRELYRKASRVIVWLGEAPQPFLALQFLLHIYNQIKFRNLSDQELKTILKIGTKELGWPNLFHILENPFWKRIWIIQEIAVATKVQLYYGGFLFNWDLFAAIMRSLSGQRVGSLFILTAMDKIPSSLLPPIIGRDQILLISDIRDTLHQSHSISLGDLLYRTSRCLSTDPRDRVFALLGMSDDKTNRAIIPDYQQDIAILFTSTSKYLITSENDQFCSLHHAGIGYERRTNNLPSWVVDWNSEAFYRALWTETAYHYQASKGYDGHVQINEDSQTICVTGFQFDEIMNCGPVRLMQTGDTAIFSMGEAIRQSFLETCTLADLDSPELYKTGESRVEALWRCLVGDCNRLTFDRPANPNIGDSFNATRKFNSFGSISESRTLEESLELGKRIYPERQWRSDEEAGRNIDEEDAKTRLFNGTTSNAFGGRKFANTKSGYYAVVPPLTESGDIVCLIDGAQTPFVLRREGDRLYLVGECYVHGIMDGEIAGDGVREKFTLH